MLSIFTIYQILASVFMCPEVNITAVAPSDGNSVAVNWTSSLIGNDTGSLQVTYDRTSGDPFPIGATIVNYTMVDERTGASKDCTFMVIVFGECSLPPVAVVTRTEFNIFLLVREMG